MRLSKEKHGESFSFISQLKKKSENQQLWSLELLTEDLIATKTLPDMQSNLTVVIPIEFLNEKNQSLPFWKNDWEPAKSIFVFFA